MRAHRLLTTTATARAGARAIHWIDRDRSLTYAATVDAMHAAAQTLTSFGVLPGGRVGVFAHPGLDYVVALLGAWCTGAAAVLVDLRDKQSFGSQMSAAAPDAIIYTNDHFEYVEAAMPALPSVKAYAGMDGPQPGAVGWLESLAAADPMHNGNELDDGRATDHVSPLDDGRAIAHVSFPDGATSATEVSHDELVVAAAAVAARVDLDSTDRTLCATPLSGRFHLETSILPALARGATAGLLKSWTAEAGWEAMDNHGCTVLCADGQQCADVLAGSVVRERGPAGLRAVVTKSDANVDELTARFRQELAIDVAVV